MLAKKIILLSPLFFYVLFNSALAQELILNSEEQAYLKKAPTIKMCVDPDWLPYEKLDSQGRHIGLVAEYMALISSRLNLNLSVVKTTSWEETQKLYQNGMCDIVSALNKTPERENHLLFTEPYIKSPAVLVIKNSNVQTRQLADLNGKKLAMVKGYVYDEKLRKDYPGIQIAYQTNMGIALHKVSTGEIDATLGPLFLIFALTQEQNLDNVKIMGNSEYQDELRIGIKLGNTILANIFNKAVSSLSAEDHTLMRKSWAKKRKQ
ncbi:MAG: transporter substrate-binding domain-containing protein [Gammaproteobacteria bacterium]|nr:MAG: transporter substrate-binding domain-containing protein [Gammaproteobacteria bacterium]